MFLSLLYSHPQVDSSRTRQYTVLNYSFPSHPYPSVQILRARLSISPIDTSKCNHLRSPPKHTISIKHAYHHKINPSYLPTRHCSKDDPMLRKLLWRDHIDRYLRSCFGQSLATSIKTSLGRLTNYQFLTRGSEHKQSFSTVTRNTTHKFKTPSTPCVCFPYDKGSNHPSNTVPHTLTSRTTAIDVNKTVAFS
jgi:hypothetical protein